MNIQKNLDNAVLTLTLQSRLDAITAPLLNEVVENELTGVKKLILDFGFVEYVSSAGLRVILTAQDIMDEQGEMKVIRVNETVMEIFDITGLVDLLTIE
ncbi:MAG: STAS domain-containing protein [Clostridia bacterium]|nr:STAS domain-containing protein [Clostridia bacterium]